MNNPFAEAITGAIGGIGAGLGQIKQGNRLKTLMGLAQDGDKAPMAELAELAPRSAEMLMMQDKAQAASDQESDELQFRKMVNIIQTARDQEDPNKIRASLQSALRKEQDQEIRQELVDTLNQTDDQLLFDLDSSLALAKANLGEGIGQTGSRGVQFGAQQTFKDSKGNLFFGTQKRDPQTGQTETTLSPIGNAPANPIGSVNLVGAFGETASEATQRKLVEAQQKADIDVETDVSKLTGKKREERIDTVIDTGIAATSVIPTYDRILALVDAVSTGGVQAGIQRARQLFGWEAADLGELDALFKESVLGNIKQLGANPTEGERKFIVEASGSIGQNPAVLKRLIKRRKSQAESAVKKGIKFATDRGDEDALFLLQGQIDQNQVDQPGQLPAPIPGSSAAQEPTIDELVEKYAK